MNTDNSGKRDPQTYEIIGAAIEVHRILGNGFLEAVYQEALAIEFSARDMPFQKECMVDVGYKGRALQCKYRADFICHHEIIVEIKALDRLSPNEDAQVLNYLKATGFERALLINFGQTQLQHRRLIRSKTFHSHPSA